VWVRCDASPGAQVLDHMEERVGGGDGGGEGGHVVDYHSCDLFPERWFDPIP
jgi:adenylate kinase